MIDMIIMRVVKRKSPIFKNVQSRNNMFETKLATEAAATNQDRAAIIEHPNGQLLVIADGAGGMGGGGEAAELLIQTIKDSVVPKKHFVNPLMYCSLLVEADERLSEHPMAGETTAIIVALSKDFVCGASVGDSGAFLVQEQTIELTAQQQRRPFLGSGMAAPTPFGPEPFEGTLLIATDGLIKYAKLAIIHKILLTNSSTAATKALIECVRYPSGELPDDVTVIISHQ